MNLNYEYRLYVRPHERILLEKMLEQGREVYNAALMQCRQVYETTQKHQTAISQWSYFRDWRKQAGILLNASSLQHILRRVDKAYSAFFRRLKAKETPGLPRFKGRNRFDSLEYTYGDGIKLHYDETLDRYILYVQNIGEIKVKFHRPLPQGTEIKHAVLKHRASGWYVYFLLELPSVQLPLPLSNELPAVGGDMGLLRLLTLSDGEMIDNPRWLRQALNELREAQRTLTRRQKGSHNREESRLHLARLHEHVARIRRDFWHKLTYWLAHNYGWIVLESLNLSFMTRNTHLALSAQDAGLGIFQKLLVYKAADAGSHVSFVDPHNTSQECSGCGRLVPKELSVRIHRCPHPDCSLELDRDVNAARNILVRAKMHSIGLDQVVRPTDSTSPDGSLKSRPVHGSE